MKMRLTIIFLFFVQVCFGQINSISSNGFYIPKNINECNSELDKIFGKYAKEKIKSAEERSLRNAEILCINGEWFENDTTTILANYFKQFSITDLHDRNFLILLSYHRYINNKPFDIEFESKKIINKRDSIEIEREERRKINIKADSIDGIFIPADLNSCFVELDRLLNDTTKQEIKNKNDSFELIGEYHMGLGRWLRNNWELWGGSRLQVYFHDRQIFHPDEMSSMILESYAKYLNGKTFDSDEIIQTIHTEHEEFMKSFELKETIMFTPPKFNPKKFYTKEYRRFLRTKKINDIGGIY
jgi:hypothetical protein